MQSESTYQTSTLAIVSLVTGILSWFILPILGGIVAVITGHMARKEIRNSFGTQTGDILAILGLILGYLNLIVSCVLPVLILAGFISVGGILALCGIASESVSFVSGNVMPPLN
jgi:hypothetical protein